MKLAYSSVQPLQVIKKLPPVIMLHGMLDSRKTWTLLAPKIASQTGRKVYCLDARNHGESPWSNDFDFESMTRDLDDFMVEHKIPKATLVGHSMGGKTIMRFATQKPEKAEKIVVEDMIPKRFRMNAWSIVVMALLLQRESLTAIPKGADEHTAKRAVGRFFVEHLPSGMTVQRRNPGYSLQIMPLKKIGDSYQWETNLDVLEKALTTNENFDTPITGNYTSNALFIYGTKSFIKIANEPTIRQFFPNAQMLPIEGASHLVHFEHPDEFLEEVVKFINDGSEPSVRMPPSKY